MSNILFCLTGSISCYKACEVISALKKKNHTVKTVASPAALKFIGEATLEGLSGERVATDTFATGEMMSHIDLARWADLIIVCPASARTINSLAAGTLEGLIGEIFLANNFKKPFLIAPSMNQEMLLHPATQKAMGTLETMKAIVLETDTGPLACGEVGYGRLLAPEKILERIEKVL